MKNKVNEIQISYREKISVLESPSIKGSWDAGKLLFEKWDKNTIGLHESFKVVMLNRANKVKGIHELSKGGIYSTSVDIRILFATALRSLSVGMILAHNHPSGTLRASEADIALTKKIKKISNFHNISVFDHLIIVPSGEYFSFKDGGLL